MRKLANCQAKNQAQKYNTYRHKYASGSGIFFQTMPDQKCNRKRRQFSLARSLTNFKKNYTKFLKLCLFFSLSAKLDLSQCESFLIALVENFPSFGLSIMENVPFGLFLVFSVKILIFHQKIYSIMLLIFCAKTITSNTNACALPRKNKSI